AALLRSCRSRTVQQRGGELHAAGGAGPEELAARRQRKGWAQGRGDPFGGGVLPQAWPSGERLSDGGTARHESEKTFRSRSSRSRSLGRAISNINLLIRVAVQNV